MRYGPFLRLAHELHKQLHEVMGWSGPMTDLQFQVWQEWLDDQWNEPSRSDFYAMQTAYETRYAQAESKPGGSLSKLMKIPFHRVIPPKPKTPEELAEEEKQLWMAHRNAMLIRSGIPIPQDGE